ncbi:MAG: sulfur oxidation c-type cytochrome SoxA [Alphaproteobacteria bacterium]
MRLGKNVTKALGAGVAALTIAASGLFANAEPVLNIEGVGVLQTRVKAPTGHPLSEIISGWEFRTKETQALELDDFSNPGSLWLETGEGLWSEVDGTEGKACASCHGDAAESMRTVGAKLPKWSESRGKPINIEMQINECRTDRMKAKAWKWESNELLSMTTYVKSQSRGVPVQVDVSGKMAPWFDKGKEIYYTRNGQLDMACSNCHEDYYGKSIRADRLSQGQSNGFPVYRLKWQKVGSLHRRFKGCMKQVRAKPFKVGGDEFLALEVYLAYRGQGLPVETPAVRQ